MEPLTAEDVLQLWERGERLRPLARTLALLARARRGVPVQALESMTIGESELTLLELRMTAFGDEIRAVDGCPGCGTLVECSLDAAALIRVGTAGLVHGAGDVPTASRRLEIDADGWVLRFRLPTVGDLVVLARQSDPAQARICLLERCLESARTPDGAEARVTDLAPALQAQVAAAMDEADPAAQLTTTMDCPDCRTVWEASVDIATFFWRELSVMARRLLREVHELASRYGWSESQILRLSAVRRHAYLEGRWA